MLGFSAISEAPLSAEPQIGTVGSGKRRMNLTTLDRVKTALGGEWTSEQDAFLRSLIRAVSARAAQFLGRGTERKERTEVFDVEEDQRTFSLLAYPVTGIVSVRHDTSRMFEDDTEVEEDSYFVDVERGLLIFERGILTAELAALSVTYEGGMGAIDGTDGETSDEFAEAYPDIAAAVDAQVVELYRRRDRMGGTNFSFGEGSTAFEGPVSLLKFTRETLDPHRRVMLR